MLIFGPFLLVVVNATPNGTDAEKCAIDVKENVNEDSKGTYLFGQSKG